jgi:pimeloyl-ACP methyl ester carboxylesterase
MVPASDPIEVRAYGQTGDWVVLLHGGPGAPGEMAPVARRLCRQFHILEPLQRSGGAEPLTAACHVADLRKVLQGPLQAGPVRLVGFSWGAMLALTYAAREPEGIDRLVLIGCGTFDSYARAIYERRMTERTGADERRRLDRIASMLAAETDPDRRNGLLSEMGAICTQIQAFDPVGGPSLETLRCDERAFRETWADVLSLQEQGVQPAEFARIRVPVTMIHGADDPHPGRSIYESLQRFVPSLRYRELPRCGHKPWIERHAAEPFYAMLAAALQGDSS